MRAAKLAAPICFTAAFWHQSHPRGYPLVCTVPSRLAFGRETSELGNSGCQALQTTVAHLTYVQHPMKWQACLSPDPESALCKTAMVQYCRSCGNPDTSCGMESENKFCCIRRLSDSPLVASSPGTCTPCPTCSFNTLPLIVVSQPMGMLYLADHGRHDSSVPERQPELRAQQERQRLLHPRRFVQDRLMLPRRVRVTDMLLLHLRDHARHEGGDWTSRGHRLRRQAPLLRPRLGAYPWRQHVSSAFPKCPMSISVAWLILWGQSQNDLGMLQHPPYGPCQVPERPRRLRGTGFYVCRSTGPSQRHNLWSTIRQRQRRWRQRDHHDRMRPPGCARNPQDVDSVIIPSSSIIRPLLPPRSLLQVPIRLFSFLE